MKLATLRPGIAVGYWKARKSPRRARLSGDSARMSRPFQMTSPRLDHVGGVTHQRVGEGRLAGAVGSHDGVDLALADGQVDPLQDLTVGSGGRRDAQAADDELLVGVGGHGWVWAPVRGVGWIGASRRGGTRSARVIESRAPATASRTRTHRTLTVQRDERSHTVGVLGVVAGAHHRGDGPLERSQDLGHGDRLGWAGEFVAAMRATGAGHEAGLAQAHDELLEVGARVGLPRRRSRRGWPGRSRRAAPAGPSGGRRTRPSC